MSRKFLIVQIGKLGDMVLTTPLFYGLKRLFPYCTVDVICSESNYEVCSNDPSVDSFFLFEKNVHASLKLLNKLRKHEYDFFIDIKPEFSKTTSMLKRFARYKSSAGFPSVRSSFQIDLNEYRNGEHYTSYTTAILNYFGDPRYPNNILPVLYSNEKMVSNQLKDIATKKYIFINTSSGRLDRTWSENNFRNLIELLTKKYVHSIVVNKHSSDNFKTPEFLSEKVFSPKMNYNELVFTIKNSIAVISPDTSSIHIASSFNIPTVGLYNGVQWNLQRFYPLSDKKIVLISDNEKNLDSINPGLVMKSMEAIL